LGEMIETFEQLVLEAGEKARVDRKSRLSRRKKCHLRGRCSKKSINSPAGGLDSGEMIEKFEQLVLETGEKAGVALEIRLTRLRKRSFVGELFE